VLSTSGDLEEYRVFLIRASGFCSRFGSLGMIVGGGFAKNPADAPTRRFIFEQFHIFLLAHFLNLKQLFTGASSRISFVLLAGSRTASSSKVRLGYELLSFDELVSLALVELERIQSRLKQDADLTKLTSQSVVCFRGDGNVITAMEQLNIKMDNDLHRTGS